MALGETPEVEYLHPEQLRHQLKLGGATYVANAGPLQQKNAPAPSSTAAPAASEGSS